MSQFNLIKKQVLAVVSENSKIPEYLKDEIIEGISNSIFDALEQIIIHSGETEPLKSLLSGKTKAENSLITGLAIRSFFAKYQNTKLTQKFSDYTLFSKVFEELKSKVDVEDLILSVHVQYFIKCLSKNDIWGCPMSVSFDYSRAVLGGMAYTDFCNYYSNYSNFSSIIESNEFEFIRQFNSDFSEEEQRLILSKSECELRMVVKPISLNLDSSRNCLIIIGSIEIFDSAGNTLALLSRVKDWDNSKDYKTYQTIFALGPAYKVLAERIVSMIKREMKERD